MGLCGCVQRAYQGRRSADHFRNTRPCDEGNRSQTCERRHCRKSHDRTEVGYRLGVGSRLASVDGVNSGGSMKFKMIKRPVLVTTFALAVTFLGWIGFYAVQDPWKW